MWQLPGCLQPKTIGYPVGVEGCGFSKGGLSDASSEARDAGVYGGMLLEAAMRRCPDLRVVDPLPAVYNRVENFLTGPGFTSFTFGRSGRTGASVYRFKSNRNAACFGALSRCHRYYAKRN